MSNILILRSDRTQIAQAALLFPACAFVISGSPEYTIVCCFFLDMGEGCLLVLGKLKKGTTYFIISY